MTGENAPADAELFLANQSNQACIGCHTTNPKKYPGSFAYKVHKADGHYLKHAGLGSSTVVKTDCATCHTAEGIELGRAPDRVWRDVNATGETVWASSDAGACLTCHRPTDSWFKESTRAHIETNDGVLDALDKDTALNATEGCATCHSPEQVIKAHGH